MYFQSIAQELLGTSRYIMSAYLSDMTDEDILICPVSGAHHAAWQLGHLISSERRMVDGVRAGFGVDLPADFEVVHSKEVAHEAVVGCLPIARYVELLSSQRAKTLALLLELKDSEFAQPAPEFMRGYAKHVSSVFLSIASHELMHAGQIAVIRRVLGKPIVV
jgi:hypothetical protein